MAQREGANPKIEWDGEKWSVRLPVDNGKVIDASWKPGATYVVRIREAGAEEWSFGFETPVASFTFVDLKPDTGYELQVRVKNAGGEGPPAFMELRTGPTGDRGNVIQFPKHGRHRSLPARNRKGRRRVPS